MNKIISANINGFVFQIDELAYTKLNAYLSTIKQKVGNAEVAQDIENRIAELFDEKLKSGLLAIFDKDVDEVMQQIGNPEQFAGEEQNEANQQNTAESLSGKTKKRLYRDNDDKVIGGVCSGISAYFGLDPVIVRLAFAASFMFFGTGIILYILLMIVIPKAITPGEKLEMRGEPLDYKNVSKTVEKDFKDAFDRYKPEVKTGFQRFVEIAVRVGMIMLIIFLLSVFIPGCFGIITGIGIASWSLPSLSSYMFTSESETIVIIVGLALFLLIPMFGILYSILRFAFKTRRLPRVVSITLSALWFSGFCMLGYSTYKVGSQFSSSYKVTSADSLNINSNTLILRANPSPYSSKFILKDEDGEGERHIRINSEDDLKDAIDKGISENVKLNIVYGFSNKPVVKITRYSNGPNHRVAWINAEKIQYKYELKDSILYLDEAFSLPGDQLWRNQKVRITVEVPSSYRLMIDESCESILDVSWIDEDELTNRYLKVDHSGIRVRE